MATSVVFPRVQFLANNGRPLIGGRIHTYVAGSSTRARTYQDADKAQPNANPIILDARGEASVYLAEGVEYKFVIEDSTGALIVTQEPVYGAVWPNAAEWPSDATLSYQYMTEAKAAAGAIGPIKFFDTKAQADAAILTLANGDILEVSQDETRAGARTRYKVQEGALVFVVNLDQTRLDLANATDPAKGAEMVGYLADGGGAVPTTVQAKLREIISVKDFGAVGDGSDDTTKIQNALNAAAGKTLFLEAGKTYGYTTLTIKAGTTITSNGATFNRLSASTTPGFTIENGVTIDSFDITTPGGSGGDRAVAIRGSNITINRLSITAAAQGAYNSTNYAVEIESSPVGTQLSNITINKFYCKYFTAGMFIKNVDRMRVDGALVDYFRTAFYLRDVSRSEFSNVTCRYTSSTSYGAPGENGLLLESSLSSSSCFDLRFNGWSVIGAGEHSYRLGGQLTIRDVWFDNCRSWGSGSAILVNNPVAAEWHGGCGFKVLGATTVTGQKHKNIFFNNCHVEDINETYGVFPTGHGAGNFAGFQIACVSNVYITGCSVRKRDNVNYSCGYGAEILASDHVYLTDVSFEDMYQTVRLYEASGVGAYPGWDLPCEHIYFNNCLIHSSNAGLGYLVGIGENYQNFDHKNISLNRCHLSGASHAVRINPITGTGSYADIYLDFTYTNTTANPNSAIEPFVYGATAAVGNIRAPWCSSAYMPSLLNGSIWQDTYSGQIWQKTDNVWRRDRKTYSVQIANNSFAVITPPVANAGFIAVSGGGVATHMMGWYRATSTPSSSKYSGAATAVMVNTALTGTTGTAGNITIGVQNNAIYIENRNSPTDIFVVTFL